MTTTANAADTILAVDMGKYKSGARVYRAAGDVRFLSIPTTRNSLIPLSATPRRAVVVFDARLLAGCMCGRLGSI